MKRNSLAELREKTSGEIAQSPVVVDIRSQAELSTDHTSHDGGNEVVELKRRTELCNLVSQCERSLLSFEGRDTHVFFEVQRRVFQERLDHSHEVDEEC